MANNDAFAQLRNLIASVCHDEDDCRRLCRDAGLSPEYIGLGGKMINVWDKVARQAHKQRRLIKLVEVAKNDISDDSLFQQLLSLAAQAQAQPLPGSVLDSIAAPEKPTIRTTQQPIFGDNDRVQLVNILVRRTEFQEGARARQVLLRRAEIAQLLPEFDWEGEPETVAGDLILQLEYLLPLPDSPDRYPLGKFLDFLLQLSGLAEDQCRVCARLIVRYRLVRVPGYLEQLCSRYALDEERLPETAPHQTSISNRLAARRYATSPAKAIQSYRLDYNRILHQFDLDRQMEEITSRLRQLPHGGLIAFTAAGDRALIADYLIPRLLRDVQDRLAYKLMPHNAYLHVSSAGNIEMSFEGIELNEIPQDRPLSWMSHLRALASEEDTHRLVMVWNHSLSSPQMEVFASHFVAESNNDFVALLQRHGLLYVFVWISLQPHDFSGREALCCLSPFESLDPEFVQRWFQMKLGDAGVAPLDIDRAVDRLTSRLRANHGIPHYVFHAVREIIDDLNQGRV